MTTKPLFMSAEHVALMNRLLAADSVTLAECAKLQRSYWLVHELDDNGRVVWWSLEFSPGRGMRFSLEPPPAGVRPDIVMRGKYGEVVEATRRGKAGETVPYPVVTEGDQQSMAVFGAAFAAGRHAATVETVFPHHQELK